MQKQTLSLCIISAGTKIEAALLDRALKTGELNNQIDEICLTITYDKDKEHAGVKAVEDIGLKYGAKITYFKWIDDYAAARNFNFEQATSEFIFWIDTDDIVHNAHLLKPYLRRMEKEHIDGLVFSYLFSFDEYGYCNTRHNKLRIIKNDKSYLWYGGGIHEDMQPNRQTQQIWVQDIEIKHLKNFKGTSLEGKVKVNLIDRSAKRNLRIAKNYYQANPKDPRHLYNLINASFGVEDWANVINYGQKFIEVSRSKTDKYVIWVRIGDAFYNDKDYESAIAAYMNCLEIAPWLPDGYLSLGRAFYMRKQWKHAKTFIMDGIRFAKTKAHETQMAAWDPRDYDLTAFEILGAIYLKESNLDMAYTIFRKLVDQFPKNKKLKKQTQELREMVDELAVVDLYCDQVLALKEKTPEEIKHIIDKVPKNLRSHAKILILQNEYCYKKESTGMDIAIYCGQTGFEWSPESVKTGIGGSEEAVINLAPQLQKLGWNVTIYNSCGYRGYEQFVEGCDPVIWRPFWEFNNKDHWDVLISWRHPLIFQYKEELKHIPRKYVWLHDVLPKEEFTSERLENINKVFPLSKFHRNLYPNIPDKQIIVSANGIDPGHFDYPAPYGRKPHRLIYTSAPDRGLDVLTRKIFPMIRKEIPDAELHWIYGWQTYMSINAGNDELISWALELRKDIEQTEGMFDDGRVGHLQVAREIQKSAIWIYPTMFPEIFCISAVKAQQGGAVPVVNVVTKIDGKLVNQAVDEVVSDNNGIKTYFDNLYEDPDQQAKYAKIVIDLMKDQDKLKAYRESGLSIHEKFNWASIAKQWSDEFGN